MARKAKKPRGQLIFHILLISCSAILLFYALFLMKRSVFLKTAPVAYEYTNVLGLRTKSESHDKIITNGSRKEKKIALTFDADMTYAMKESYLAHRIGGYDKALVDTLVETKTPATFFLTGLFIELFPEQTRMLAANPLFELGNHSYSHPSFQGFCYGLSQISDSEDMDQIEKTQKLLKNVAHVINYIFRFPGGCYSEHDLNIVRERAHMMIVHWDVVGGDGFNVNAQSIINNVVSRTQNGSIIVLHANGAPTAPKTKEALPHIISELKAKGFEFVKVSDLLHLN